MGSTAVSRESCASRKSPPSARAASSSSSSSSSMSSPRSTGDAGVAMTSANLDLVRLIVAAWESGDFGSAEWAHPEIEYVWADGPTPGSWTGLAGMAEGEREFLAAWEECRFEAVEY